MSDDKTNDQNPAEQNEQVPSLTNNANSQNTGAPKTDKDTYAARQKLEEEAQRLNVDFRANIGDETLRARIKEAKEKGAKLLPDNAPVVAAPEHTYRSPAEVREKKQKELSRLVRVHITCMNPNKSAWQGEIFCFGNEIVSLKRMVPFDVDTHVEKALLDMIKARRYRVAHKPKKGKGSNQVSIRMVPEFAIKELTPLSQEEMKDLAAQQAAAAGNS
tara:strand:- start:21527 stop:22177 length:651 start_codon:yes stop_codon:yes gene_type:complete